MPYGLKHEIAKRWPIHDWQKSRKVARLINPTIADKAIKDLIYRGKPGLVGRLGGTEARFLGEFKKIFSLPFLTNLIFRVKPNWIKTHNRSPLKAVPILTTTLSVLIQAQLMAFYC